MSGRGDPARRLRRALALAFVVTVAAGVRAAEPAHAQSVTRVYAVQNRNADDLLPLAETALGGEGRAVVDRGTNSLVLLGTERAVADAMSVLQQQDRRLRSVVLRYESRSARDLEAAGFDVAWSAGSGPVRIGNVRAPDDLQGAVIRGGARSGERARELSGTLRITEGERGRILTGSAAPVTTRSVTPGWGAPVVTESTQWVSAESGFEASVRILGSGQVRVELVPFDASMVRGGAVRSNEAATTVVIEPGSTVAVGGIQRAGASRRVDVPTGARAERSREDLVLLLSAEVD